MEGEKAWYAVALGGHLEVVCLLLKAGVDKDAAREDWEAALPNDGPAPPPMVYVSPHRLTNVCSPVSKDLQSFKQQTFRHRISNHFRFGPSSRPVLGKLVHEGSKTFRILKPERRTLYHST